MSKNVANVWTIVGLSGDLGEIPRQREEISLCAAAPPLAFCRIYRERLLGGPACAAVPAR